MKAPKLRHIHSAVTIQGHLTRNPEGDPKMLTPTHLIVCVFIGLLLHLNRNEWFVALTFGVVIDVDHVFALPRYVSDNGWSAILRPTWDDASGLPWRSLLHEPVGGFIVGYLSIGWRLMLPLIFWGVHVFMDRLQIEFIDYSTPIESAILIGAVFGSFVIGYHRWVVISGEKTWSRYLMHLWAIVRTSIARKGSVTP